MTTVSLELDDHAAIRVRRSQGGKEILLSAGDLIIWFHDEATARKVAEGIIKALDRSAEARPPCPYCGSSDHLAGSPASDRCREKALNSGDGAYRP